MRFATIALAAGMFGASCAGVKASRKSRTRHGRRRASMWVEPTDLASRDLFHGPWGAENAPDPKGVYTLVERKHTGVNLGMTVKDDKGREWSVKQPFPGSLDSEAPVEVVVSRLLSAIGYHQPPVYFLPAFTLKDDLGKTRRSRRPLPPEGPSAEGNRRLELGRQPVCRQQGIPGPDRAPDDVQQHRPQEQQQLALRTSRRRPRRAVVRGARSRLRARRLTTRSRRARTIPSRSSRCRSSSA